MDIESRRDSFVVFLRDKAMLKSAEGAVSIGLLVCSHPQRRNCKPKNQNYDVFVQSVSCRFWNHTKWVKDGCEVS